MKVAGVDHVGLGSDFDGATMPIGMEDASKLPKITDALLKKGYSDADVTKILGGNLLRVMEAVEHVAGRERLPDRPRRRDTESETCERSADAVIIGGGCMGASVAYHLARLGITDTVLVEREKMLGTGSTGRNAGGVRHQFSNEANIRLSIESIGLLERFADEVGQPIDFHQDGYLFLLSTPASVDTFRDNVARQRRLGIDVQWLDAGEAERLAPGLKADGVIGATFCQRDGIADPNGVTMGFARRRRPPARPSSARQK